jgi:DNA-binding PadR family transcriptional regulator
MRQPHHHGPREGADYTRGRKFSSDELQLMLLALLQERPSHGYELIKALEQRSDGFYSPSPGMVYPALTFLEERGDADSTLQGNRKSYALTKAGKKQLAAQHERIELLMAGLDHMARKMRHLRGAIAEDAGAQAGQWLPEFIAARQGIKRALLRKSAAGHEEQRRIVAILERAAREIDEAPSAGKPPARTGRKP